MPFLMGQLQLYCMPLGETPHHHMQQYELPLLMWSSPAAALSNIQAQPRNMYTCARQRVALSRCLAAGGAGDCVSLHCRQGPAGAAQEPQGDCRR